MSRTAYLSSGLLVLAAAVFLAPDRLARAEADPLVSYGRVPADAYAVVAQVRARPGKEAELRAVTLSLIARVRAENGNLAYFLHEDREAPGHFVFYEIFTTREAFEAHNRSAHVQEWFAKLPSLAAGDVKVTRMQVLGATR